MDAKMNEALLSLWTSVLIYLEDKITPVGYEAWIKNIKPTRITTETLFLSVETIIMKSMIEQRYLEVIKEALLHLKGKEYEVKVSALEEMPEEEEEIEEELPLPMEEQKKGTILSKFTFDNFVVGSGNRFAHAASISVAQEFSSIQNPLFLYGGVGLGKTHLLMAIGNYIKEHEPSLNVLYISAENFTSELVDALGNNKMKEFRNKFHNVDVFLVDDIQFIESRGKSEEEFFHTFEALYQANKRIVLTCDCAPEGMMNLAERLKGRFSWGIVSKIDPPDYETRIAILKKKAAQNNITIQDEVILFIAENVSNNIRELEGVLNRLISYHSLLNKEITLDFVKEMIEIKPHPTEITPSIIIDYCARYFRISTDDILSQKRTKELVTARHVAMYLCREELDLSHPKIAKLFGKKDHTTVMNACSNVQKDYNAGGIIKFAVDTIRKDIHQK